MTKTAEKGKIHTLFIADTPSFGGAGGGADISYSPAFPLEPMVMLSACLLIRKAEYPRIFRLFA